jgi:two-component system NarL family response regulator
MLDVLIAVEQPSLHREFQAISQEREDVRLWYKGARGPDFRRPSAAAGYDVIVIGSDNSGKQLTLERITLLKRRYADCSFVLMAQDLEWFAIAEYCRAGVYGFVDEHASCDQIVSAISAASRKDLYVASSITCKLASSSVLDFRRIFANMDLGSTDISKLSERELETLKLVAKGMSNKAIAQSLFISEKTVKNHLYNVYKKLGVRDRTQAAIAVIKTLCSHQNESFGPI